VRDNTHSHDVARFIEAFLEEPRVAEVYDLGGGSDNSCSIWEAFQIAEQHSGKTQMFEYVDENHIGDHICYFSDLSKMRDHYPQWPISISLEETIGQIVQDWQIRET
jgi:CDP-paratose 2-epimerase